MCSSLLNVIDPSVDNWVLKLPENGLRGIYSALPWHESDHNIESSIWFYTKHEGFSSQAVFFLMLWLFSLSILVHSGQCNKVSYIGWCRQQKLIFWQLSRLRSPRSVFSEILYPTKALLCHLYSVSFHDGQTTRERWGMVRNIKSCESCLSLVTVINEGFTLKTQLSLKLSTKCHFIVS